METSCGIVLVNLDSILILQYPQGHWDLPKGHIEAEDESHKQTAFRELKEETGIKNIKILKEIDGWSEYELPENLLGKIWRGK